MEVHSSLNSVTPLDECHTIREKEYPNDEEYLERNVMKGWQIELFMLKKFLYFLHPKKLSLTPPDCYIEKLNCKGRGRTLRA